MPTYKVIRISEEGRTYHQVRNEDAVYPALPSRAVTTCIAYGIESAQEAVKLRDKLNRSLNSSL